VFEQVSNRVSAAAVELGEVMPPGGELAPKRALWRVFHEMGTAYRQQRRESGTRPAAGVRDAAVAFRRAPSFTALVTVASLLDEQGLQGRSA
jgi:hypothetical protein